MEYRVEGCHLLMREACCQLLGEVVLDLLLFILQDMCYIGYNHHLSLTLDKFKTLDLHLEELCALLLGLFLYLQSDFLLF